MILETLFEKFDLFAEAPGAVKRMRELVLELAVRGKLVAQEGCEKSLTKAQRYGEAIDESGVPYPAPVGWWWATLQASAECRAAAKVSPSTIPDDAWVLDLEDINGETGAIIQTAKFYDRRSRSTKAAFQAGDVLYGKLRPYLNKVVIAPKAGYCTTEIIPLRPLNFLSPDFLRFFLRSTTFLRYAAAKNYGMKMPRLGTKDLESAPIVIPPLAEQKRIVAKVDELMALCDRLEAEQKEREEKKSALARASLARFANAPTPVNLELLFYPSSCLRASVRKLKQVSHKGTEAQSPSSYFITPADLRKTILTLAVQGKLVPQDPHDESVDDLLTRNDEQRRKKAAYDHRAVKDNQRLLSADDRWKIPNPWSWRALTDLVLFVDYRGKTPVKLSKGIRLLTAKNVRKNQIDLFPEEFLSESDYHEWMTRGFPKRGDVLFTTEAPMGNAAVVELKERFALAQRVICFQSYGAIDSSFLVNQILSEEFKFILDKNGTGITAKGIKASKLKQLPIAIPPLPEQHRIVAKVDQLMTLVDELERQLAASRAAGEKLLNALVAELTAGKKIQAAL